MRGRCCATRAGLIDVMGPGLGAPGSQLSAQQLPQQPQPQQRKATGCAHEELRVLPALPATHQPDKFSVHLIVRAPGGVAFAGSQHVGQAVNMLK